MSKSIETMTAAELFEGFDRKIKSLQKFRAQMAEIVLAQEKAAATKAKRAARRAEKVAAAEAGVELPTKALTAWQIFSGGRKAHTTEDGEEV
jgi:hypothetical protein